jgi:hypothetical protein
MSSEDAIGVTFEHRWCATAEQARRLDADGCRIIVSLDGAGKRKQVSIPELAQLVRPGTVVKLVHAFLLARPDRRRAATLKTAFASAVQLIVDKRKGAVKDLDAGLTTAKPGHRKALTALANEQIGRSRQGLAVVETNKKRRGRNELKLTKEQIAAAKAIWRDTVDYPSWDNAQAALKEQVHQDFTKWRANRMWPGPRKG